MVDLVKQQSCLPTLDVEMEIRKDDCPSDYISSQSTASEEDFTHRKDELAKCLVNYEILRLLGEGTYGKVYLVKNRASSELLAMKVLKKSDVRAQGQIVHTWAERNILEKVKHPFVVSLKEALQDPSRLYLFMDYCPGGDIFFHLSQCGRFGERKARFYTACLVLAFEELHKKNILYRDIKPENILIDSTGFPMLTDFGLSKENVKKRTFSFCGTPEYLAPEIVMRGGHGKMADIWGLGAILYEMVTGFPPFYEPDNRHLLMKKILEGDIVIPGYLSNDLRDLLTRLLCKNPEERATIEEIKNHKWFSSVDWNLMAEKKVQPPFKPVLKQTIDTHYFAEEFTSKKIEHFSFDSEEMNDDDNELWDDFSFTLDEDEEM
eukprot:TRINITY_DN749_c0_g1_i2.p1 TRINITY_DN749_c0_g1~~TRINITY_DN749_c0_g1_i2.p1  ORF type:complete len:377 (+),score=48.73 TRINITY_DN749_c0_g1_i2:149-1279(+)